MAIFMRLFNKPHDCNYNIFSRLGMLKMLNLRFFINY